MVNAGVILFLINASKNFGGQILKYFARQNYFDFSLRSILRTEIWAIRWYFFVSRCVVCKIPLLARALGLKAVAKRARR